jgi:hypothetical protein
MGKQERVAILGASADAERFANKAQRMLKEHGHAVVPVSAKEQVIDGEAVAASLAAIEGPVDTLTLYVRAAISSQQEADILALAPRRVVFNPGTENPALEDTLRGAGIECVEACTLVMLRTGTW